MSQMINVASHHYGDLKTSAVNQKQEKIMREISTEELKIILDKHSKWLRDEDGGERADLSHANLSYADMSHSDLSSADLSYANLNSANLNSANLSHANLNAANLSSADLSHANLRSADLTFANLRYADLRYATGQYYLTQRTDGYQFFLVEDEGEWLIRAGCQYMSIEDYRKHTESYGDESKKVETNLILDFAEARLKIGK